MSIAYRTQNIKQQTSVCTNPWAPKYEDNEHAHTNTWAWAHEHAFTLPLCPCSPAFPALCTPQHDFHPHQYILFVTRMGAWGWSNVYFLLIDPAVDWLLIFILCFVKVIEVWLLVGLFFWRFWLAFLLSVSIASFSHVQWSGRWICHLCLLPCKGQTTTLQTSSSSYVGCRGCCHRGSPILLLWSSQGVLA